VRVYTVPEMSGLLRAAGLDRVTARRFRIDLFWRGGLALGVRAGAQADAPR
jgi:hypothetical protein